MQGPSLTFALYPFQDGPGVLSIPGTNCVAFLSQGPGRWTLNGIVELFLVSLITRRREISNTPHAPEIVMTFGLKLCLYFCFWAFWAFATAFRSSIRIWRSIQGKLPSHGFLSYSLSRSFIETVEIWRRGIRITGYLLLFWFIFYLFYIFFIIFIFSDIYQKPKCVFYVYTSMRF